MGCRERCVIFWFEETMGCRERCVYEEKSNRVGQRTHGSFDPIQRSNGFKGRNSN
jgi:hypothetical protein